MKNDPILCLSVISLYLISFLSAIANIGTFPFDEIVLLGFPFVVRIYKYIIRNKPEELAFTKAKQVKKSFSDYPGRMQIPPLPLGGETGFVHIISILLKYVV